MNKKAGRSNGSVTETAEFNIDKKKFSKGYDKAFGKKEEIEIEDEKIDKKFYYLNKLFPSDRAKVIRIEGDSVTFSNMSNGMENKCKINVFFRYWKISKMKV